MRPAVKILHVTALAAFACCVAGCVRTPVARVAASPSYDATSADVTPQEELFAQLRPVKLQNCRLKRYGVPHDGGYLMCENLMGAATAAYSYGIDGRDDWGCDVSRQL